MLKQCFEHSTVPSARMQTPVSTEGRHRIGSACIGHGRASCYLPTHPADYTATADIPLHPSSRSACTHTTRLHTTPAPAICCHRLSLCISTATVYTTTLYHIQPTTVIMKPTEVTRFGAPCWGGLTP